MSRVQYFIRINDTVYFLDNNLLYAYSPSTKKVGKIKHMLATDNKWYIHNLNAENFAVVPNSIQVRDSIFMIKQGNFYQILIPG